jgi:hypothetical protein
MPDLIAVFLVGLLGSAHCVGMCGGFVVAVAQRGGRGTQVRQLLYFLGKTLTYALFGAVAGGVGHVIGGAFAGVQNVLSIALGIFLVGIGLGLLGVLKRFSGPRLPAWLGRLPSVIARLLKRRTRAATFGLGMVNGLLPCGLVYGVLALAAATGTPLGGALTMAVFGAATIPALYLLSVASFLMRPAWRMRFSRISGVLVVVLGLITILRGTPALDPILHLFHNDHPAHHEMVEPVRPD